MLALVACVACFLAACRWVWTLIDPVWDFLVAHAVVVAGALPHSPVALGRLELPLLLAFSAIGGVVFGTFVGVAVDFAAALGRKSIAFVKALAHALRPER
ncbi:MAG: hypothetical protein P4L85_08155 [Paludisphaera borealis]|uniref:hypothetical protein n=1 Tax=Paludisphaera borealis TaxID=1387353 RepID=UPI00283EB882|nr:hypothetical protein [Paludisphaera borealis]MDR3619308.1 hypothetical protein [Paludisphaera borealis]